MAKASKAAAPPVGYWCQDGTGLLFHRGPGPRRPGRLGRRAELPVPQLSARRHEDRRTWSSCTSSGAEPPCVAGLARVAGPAEPDPTAWDPADEHFDEGGSTPEAPVWVPLPVEFLARLSRPIALADLKANPKLEGMQVTKRGDRLSVQPVSAEHFAVIVDSGRRSAAADRDVEVTVSAARFRLMSSACRISFGSRPATAPRVRPGRPRSESANTSRSMAPGRSKFPRRREAARASRLASTPCSDNRR